MRVGDSPPLGTRPCVHVCLCTSVRVYSHVAFLRVICGIEGPGIYSASEGWATFLLLQVMLQGASYHGSLAETSAQPRVVARKLMHTCQLLPAPHPQDTILNVPVSGPVSIEAAGSPLGLVARSAGLVAGRTPACPHSCVDGLGSACEQECGASLVQVCARVSGARAVLGQRSC